MDMKARANSEHPETLRLWLRLLTCTQLIEKKVRSRHADWVVDTFAVLSEEEIAVLHKLLGKVNDHATAAGMAAP